MGAKTDKLIKEAGKIRVTGYLKRSEYKRMIVIMEDNGFHNEATFIAMGVSKLIQELSNKKAPQN